MTQTESWKKELLEAIEELRLEMEQRPMTHAEELRMRTQWQETLAAAYDRLNGLAIQIQSIADDLARLRAEIEASTTPDLDADAPQGS